MTKPRILLTRRWPEAVERHLAEHYDATFNDKDVPLDVQQLKDAVRSCDALCPTVSDRITAEVLGAANGRLKILGNFGVGFNHIDIEACRRQGIAVSNTPDVLTECTADLAMTLLLMVARRAGEGERELRSGQWVGWRPTHLQGTRVTGKTLGLIGFGRIAQATARKAHHGFGMRILYFSRRRAAAEVEAGCNAVHCDSLESLLQQSDFVSLHCPSTPDTRHLINAQRLGQMKRGAFLINTARGDVVDEAALGQALAQRTIAGAGLDVYEQEPKIHQSLLKLENVVLLPHLGSATQETRVGMGMRVAENLRAFFEGKPLPDRVV